ncbi:DUF2752 domain-containing protein [Synechococcus sp. PCC 6312]|uniref:DUF2752 domain-containing protein n=1 Tax=Synechococcus sp. (strain ATCC 27167 / PCC 6312) TaxID=195253 RepID=UPI00029F2584|nr:DUF2752 domain-containing protein [Synechococcus sp. PCC 6312]AFY61716.1 Protein of unknown function (DUF2752) [Synechococcus sp. PCC 6312]
MFDFATAVLSPQEKRTRWGFLGLATFPIAGAVILNFGLQPGFTICPMLNWTGIPCPSCGLSRSFMALVRGDLHQALSFHLFGPLFFITFIGIAVCMGLELSHNRKLIKTPFRRFTYFATWKYIFLIYLLYYGLRIASLIQVGNFYVHPFQLITQYF